MRQNDTSTAKRADSKRTPEARARTIQYRAARAAKRSGGIR